MGVASDALDIITLLCDSRFEQMGLEFRFLDLGMVFGVLASGRYWCF